MLLSTSVICSLIFSQKDQQTDKNYGTQYKETHDRNECHPDPKPLFRIGCFFKEVRITGYVFLGDGIAGDEKEKKGKARIKTLYRIALFFSAVCSRLFRPKKPGPGTGGLAFSPDSIEH